MEREAGGIVRQISDKQIENMENEKWKMTNNLS
jgi:hypothetical protein